tara:strand:- start:191 stop:484 length:294 start_codon:yes stop_codon:yes gene_type:complete
MSYVLNFVGVFAEATPRELMIQNIQEMVYVKMVNACATPRSLNQDLLAKFPNNLEKQKAVNNWIDFQLENNEVEVTMDTIVVPADGTHYIQFDMRPA